MNLNKVIIAGRVTADPQLRSTPSGQPIATMGVATNRQWTDKSGAAQESTEFHNVVVWGTTAERAAQYLQKGSLVLIEGRLQTRSWDDKQGATRRVTEIVADVVQFGPRPAGTPAVKPASARTVEPVHEDVPVINLDDEDAGEGRSLEPLLDEEPF